MIGTTCRLTCAIGAVFAMALPCQAATIYHLTAAGFLPGGNDSAAYAINGSGQIVGDATNSGGTPFAYV